MRTTLFVSDLHLDKERPEVIQLFRSFLQRDAVHAEALYILGDLFEYWLGDDNPAVGLEPVLDGLKALTGSGVPVYFLPGNRDFLIGKAFARDTGVQLLSDGTVIDLYDTRTLLMHGDTLCTDDVRYQRYRAVVRNRVFLWVLRSLSLKTRQRLANSMRRVSHKEIAAKRPAIMDVNPNAVSSAFLSSGVSLLIHGHTHRPGVHKLEIGARSVERIVLGDWYEQGSVLRCTDTGCELRRLEPLEHSASADA